jgi:DNA mismatch repair ATPase MutL
MRDVKDAAHPRGTTISVRDLFFNIPRATKVSALRSHRDVSSHQPWWRTTRWPIPRLPSRL